MMWEDSGGFKAELRSRMEMSAIAAEVGNCHSVGHYAVFCEGWQSSGKLDMMMRDLTDSE